MTGWGNAVLDKFPWNSTSLSRVKALYREGVSTRTIAVTVSAEFQPVGRNAIIGIIHRNKFESPMSKTHKPPGMASRSNLEPPPKRPRKAAVNRDGPELPDISLPPIEGDALVAFGKPCRLVGLGDSSCRWPLGEREFMFCNATAVEGHPYCVAHCRVGFRPYTRPADFGASLAR